MDDGEKLLADLEVLRGFIISGKFDNMKKMIIDGEKTSIDYISFSENGDRYPLLLTAATCFDVKYVKFFLDRGADITITSKSGKTAIDIAKLRHNYNVLIFLQEYEQGLNVIKPAKRD